MLKLFLSIVILFSATVAVISQDITATIKSDTNNVLIGEPVKLSIFVKTDGKYKIDFPVFIDTLGSLDILELYPVDTVRTNNVISGFSKDIAITSFEAGSFDVEPIVITYSSNADSDFRIVQTNSLYLQFATVEVDTAAVDIRDIKPPIQIPLTLEDMLPYIIIVIGLFVLYYLLILIFGKKQNKTIKQVPKYDPRIPADLEALEALQRLERENLWQVGKYKLYHSRLTDILRVYIHRRYHINALEMTSNEMIDELYRYEANNNAMKVISVILNIADLAKFAKYEPENEENVLSMKNAVAYINMTKVVDIEGDDGSNDVVEVAP
jgi:hypothetical protein